MSSAGQDKTRAVSARTVARLHSIIADMPLRSVRLRLLAVCAIAGALAACAPVPEGYEDWQQVNREYESRDYINTLNYLDNLLETENDYTARAAALKVVILGGMTRSALEIEEACADGVSRVAAWDSDPYKGCVEQFRWRARTRTLSLLEALSDLDRVAAADGTVALDFPLHEAAGGPPPMIGKTRVGAMPAEKPFEAAVARNVDRQIFLQVSDVVATDDMGAVKEMFEARPVTVSQETFLVGVAKTLLTAAAVFGGRPASRSRQEIRHARASSRVFAAGPGRRRPGAPGGSLGRWRGRVSDELRR